MPLDRRDAPFVRGPLRDEVAGAEVEAALVTARPTRGGAAHTLGDRTVMPARPLLHLASLIAAVVVALIALDHRAQAHGGEDHGAPAKPSAAVVHDPGSAHLTGGVLSVATHVGKL